MSRAYSQIRPDDAKKRTWKAARGVSGLELDPEHPGGSPCRGGWRSRLRTPRPKPSPAVAARRSLSSLSGSRLRLWPRDGPSGSGTWGFARDGRIVARSKLHRGTIAREHRPDTNELSSPLGQFTGDHEHYPACRMSALASSIPGWRRCSEFASIATPKTSLCRCRGVTEKR